MNSIVVFNKSYSFREVYNRVLFTYNRIQIREDSDYNSVRSIRFNSSQLILLKVLQDQVLSQDFLQLFECLLLLYSLLLYSLLLKKTMKQVYYFTIFRNEFLKEVIESQKQVYSFNLDKGLLSLISLQLFQVNTNTTSSNKESKELGFLGIELIVINIGLKSSLQS